MSKEYPLYPELSEEGGAEAQALVDKFKEHLKKAAEEVLGDLYCDVAVHIESDSWTNYRNHLMAGLRNYSNRKIQGEYDFAAIRRAIFEEYRDEIIPELNQDLLEENKALKEEIEELRRRGHFH